MVLKTCADVHFQNIKGDKLNIQLPAPTTLPKKGSFYWTEGLSSYLNSCYYWSSLYSFLFLLSVLQRFLEGASSGLVVPQTHRHTHYQCVPWGVLLSCSPLLWVLTFPPV